MIFAGAGMCFAADPLEGYWISYDDKTGNETAGWQIYADADKLCGKILSAPGVLETAKAAKCKASYPGFPVSGKVNEMPVIGSPWIFGLTKKDTGQWVNGNVIDPDDGKIYNCKLTFHPADGKNYKTDTLEMRGEIGLGLGRSQFWKKAAREDALALR